jgi:hypothetical protein
MDYPIIITNDMLGDDTPIFISRKSLRSKGMPKYLYACVSKDFYDFMRSKSFSSDMVFSSFSHNYGVWVRDKYFNRFSIGLINFKSLKDVVHVFRGDGIVTLESKYEKQVAGVFIIGDLTMVVPFKFYS